MCIYCLRFYYIYTLCIYYNIYIESLLQTDQEEIAEWAPFSGSRLFTTMSIAMPFSMTSFATKSFGLFLPVSVRLRNGWEWVNNRVDHLKTDDII